MVHNRFVERLIDMLGHWYLYFDETLLGVSILECDKPSLHEVRVGRVNRETMIMLLGV